jgi:AraC-like DNA-binding protein
MTRGSFITRSCASPDVLAIEACSSHSFPRHTHDRYGIGLIVSGAQKSWSGRGTVEAGRGNLITCNPGEVHDGIPIGGARTWKMLYLAPPLVNAIVGDIREGARADFEFVDPVVGIARRTEIGAFEAAYVAMTAPRAHAGRAQERLILLLAELLLPRPPSSGHVPAGMARAKARIDDDPLGRISLAELAREAGVSRFQIVRAFARLTGLTPHAYILQRRLDVARAMIASGVALAKAAAECGFADQSHFHWTFVRRYGVTPGAYARAMR